MTQIRNKAVPATYLMLEKDDQVLLFRRFQTGYQDGNYSLPAGHVDAGELPVSTIIREAKEEIGIEIDPEDVTFAHVVYSESSDETGDRVDFFYRCKEWKGEIAIQEPDKCDELRWCAKTNLPQNMIGNVRHVLAMVEQGVVYSELSLSFFRK